MLVTGASGFVGYQALMPLAAKGYDVHAVARSSTHKMSAEVQWHRADLLIPEQMRELVKEVCPTHLLHSAWYLEPGAFYDSPKNLDWVRASIDLLKAFHEAGGRRCVMVGTGYEYDHQHGYCTEGITPCRPTTIYGRSKDALRSLLEAYSEAVHLSSAWARVFFLYGPREYPSRLVASITNALLRDEPAPCSTGDQIRDYLHVQDVAEALVALLESDSMGPVNVGSGQPVTIRHIVDRIAGVIGREDLIRAGAVPDNPNSPPLIVANVSRLRNEVGWSPRFDLTDGLKDTVDWWRANINKEENA